jgi:hypothetical protein
MDNHSNDSSLKKSLFVWLEVILPYRKIVELG